MLDDHRAYAFVSFRRSYEVTMGYDWAAALKKHATFPSITEWITECDRMYDGLLLDNEPSRELVQASIKLVRQSLYEDIKGKFTRNPETGQLDPKYYVVPEPKQLLTEEKGYAAIDDRDETRGRLRLLRNELTSLEYEALVEYMYGGHEDMKAATSALGYTQQQYDKVRRSMRWKGQGLAWIK